ncbi:coiled-coil domain-containing protein 149 [Anabrus simplex]|uniref:coiled-coil domain-containing protein 149 n=1 Tax=Anabrus simplex TaxID=316456 RepID=UPI0034DDB44D
MTNAPRKVCVEEYVENFLAENSALRRKLQSKAEALLILSKELDQCRTERDQFKLMAEQLQDRYSTLKKKSFDLGLSRAYLYSDGLDSYSSGSSILQVLEESKEKNKALRIEVEDLRQRLRDAQGDIKVLRVRLNQQRTNAASGENQTFPSHQREELVQQLETLNQKCTQLESDLQAVLDEKEELVTERDAYKCKVHRLNHELNTLLKGDGSNRLVDIDALVMENRYLQDRLHQAEDEKDMANQALLKYKSMLEKKRSKGTVKLGTNNSTGMIMSHKQVQQLLERGTSAQLPNTAATLADMKSLCLALLEALGDKTLALSHQKKANRILATRISELEQRLEALQGGRVSAFPSQLLLEGYTGSEVDRDVSRMLAGDKDGDEEESDSEGEQGSRVSPCNGDEAKHKDVTCNHEVSVPDSTVIQKTSRLSPSLHSDSQSSMSDGAPQNDVYQHSVTEDSLPPQLQLLVQKALQDIKQEATSG